jgi:hypothetical protein
MKYVVQAVGDDELPEGITHVVVERENDPPLLLISGEVARCWRMMRSWENTLEPAWQPTITLPYERPLRLVV